MSGNNQYILKSILTFQNGFGWALFHMVLGAVATVAPYPIISWYYLLMLDTIRAFIMVDSKERNYVLAYSLVYFSAFELIGRMSSSSPFIPYESSKYLMMFISLVGITLNLNRIKVSHVGFILLLLLIPSLLIDKSGLVKTSDIVFNLFGVFNIAFAIIFLSVLKVNKWKFVPWIRLMAFPIIPVLIYVFLKTPDYSKLEFELSANFDTTGGFGSNQVSTVLGLGSFLFAVAFVLNYRITTKRLLDIAFFSAFTLQGFLTFSRGGMVGAGLGIITLIYFLMKLGPAQLKSMQISNPKKYILPTIIGLVLFFIAGNIITGGNLALRYQGQTAGTMTGKHEVDFNKFTSARWLLFSEDMSVFFEYPIFGSGGASSKYLRQMTKYEITHVELSRLIAEHGIFGIFIVLLFLYMFFKIRDSKADGINKAVQMSFFVLAIFTSFHAATRTFLSPLLVCLSMVTIVDSPPKKIKKTTQSSNEKQPSFLAGQI
ncbi:O-antigen ligase family protein [Algoriphagus sp. AGSA1]|uniref:O-antigen ligase family protein n=1 Tax=Algoriphagus sp. AGSA1 TaxID=2907213 RepID=UPI001F48B808|nr:O-antigen ligase family protein [Algoriphagus sp. AGSA1]MCE7055277.1 O-antigen ligase family protein [Algoriphagus sp. AGSA1]